MKHAITLLFVCLSLAIQSQTYNLDNNFNTDGYWISQAAADDRGYDVAVQADGKIVSVGGIGKLTNPSDAHCIVTRLNPDGTPDAGFGAGGTVQFRFDNASSIAYAMAMQPDGKILVLASIIGAGIGWHAYCPTENSMPAFTAPANILCHLRTYISQVRKPLWIYAYSLTAKYLWLFLLL